MSLDLNLAKEKGFNFGSATITDKQELLNDAAILTPNASVPAYMRAYADPRVVEILTAARNYRKIAPEVKFGDVTTSFARFASVEFTGTATPYGDYDGNGQVGVNAAYPVREQYLFQTTLKVGDLEQAMNASVNLDLYANKQKSAAILLDTEFNRFALYGVAGKSIYGLLNDPNLNTAISPETVDSSTDWDGKTCDEQMADINKLYKALIEQAGGHIDDTTPLAMLISPGTMADLNKRNAYGIACKDMVKDTFPNMEIVVVPELANASTGDTMIIMAKEIMGQNVVEFGYSEKYHAHEPVRGLSDVSQKISAGTYGAIVYLPFAIATMTGI